MYGKILAPTDGSDGSLQAIEHAIQLASLFNADLHLLYVVDPDQFSADKPEDEVESMLADLEHEGRTHVAEMEALAVDASVGEIETSIRRAAPSEAILEYVGDHGIELVVMGTHGAGGYERVKLGSVATQVVRRVEEPLLLI